MKQILLVILLITCITQAAKTQDRQLTIDDCIMKQRTTLAPRRMVQLQWIKGTDFFSYVDTAAAKNTLMKGHATDKDVAEVISLADLNQAVVQQKLGSQSKFPGIKWLDANSFRFTIDESECTFDLNKRELKVNEAPRLGESATNIDEHEASGQIAFTVDNNLYVFDGQKKVTVTSDPDTGIVNGQSVHRDEFGIFKGTFWSPGGNYLAYYRMDQSMVTNYPLTDFTTQPAGLKNIRYPMAGSFSHHVTLWIFELATGKKWQIKTTGDPEHYLTNVAWSPDEKSIYMAELNRQQDYMTLNRYNALTGDYDKTLFEEKSEKYVHPTHAMLFLKGNSKRFIWQSERDGFNHLYLYETDGKLIRQLTKGNFVVTSVLGFDKKGQRIYYMSTKESAVSRHLYGYDMKSNVEKKLTDGDGTHNITMNDDGTYFIDEFQSTITPRDVSIVSAFAAKKKYMLIAENPLKPYKLGRLKIFTLNASDGTDLYCRQYWPVDFDSTKKYPVIVYVYGGPNVQLINNTWNAAGDLWFQHMAQKGYVVFTLENRGTTNRGLKFEQATFRNLGHIELLDQLVGVNYLKSQRYVDSTRLGIMGWSYGGFMTTGMMVKYPGIFKVAVAGGPVIDWSYYEVMYTERYMDTPLTNPEGYDASNLAKLAGNLSGKLMLIHGSADDVVVMQHSMLFLKACIDQRKQVDFFTYPGHPHNVRGKDRVHLFEKITQYFDANL